ncbi:heparan-alpha-glucosaminide N-acetyltransferase domain-containing protein [Curtobacterium sp. Leaf261]|uniref:heparan-alpha-glucosaminide N-acetyltransferase domain-containing protein n=1 Tax=Curtobacterium sp. Leaf261 TaxID=1736311 RepID=UPI0006F254A2|nr:heparan-alpha-glucosaminide N-acetyltransferase domain-containing protein [Curtobacterium sp. Leaf261]KQO61387.1 hypothetical protein ASF23_12990 [Curtobacterium sp. Leaf261]
MTTTTTRRPGRLVGIDLARALAVLGMIVVHVGNPPEAFHLLRPETWGAVVQGRSSTVFALLAGVSLALMTGGSTPHVGARLRTDRARIALRAGIIAVIGVGLVLLGTQAIVILPVYGVVFLIALPALRWRRRTLLIVAGVAALLAVPASILTAVGLLGVPPMIGAVIGTYPLVTFLAYVLVGVAVGRSDLSSVRVQRGLLGLGVVLALMAYSVGGLLAPIGGRSSHGGLVEILLTPRTHSSSLVDVVGTIGVALAVVGLGSLVAGRGGRWLRPLVAVGSMPLSLYAGHILVIAIVNAVVGGRGWDGALAGWLFVLGAVVVAVLWRSRFRRGPLEGVIAAVVVRAVPGPAPTLRPTEARVGGEPQSSARR